MNFQKSCLPTKTKFLCLLVLALSSTTLTIFSPLLSSSTITTLCEKSSPETIEENHSLPIPATKKPTFYVHVGPTKTGTTSLQCFLGQNENVLKEYGYLYLGTYFGPLCSSSKSLKDTLQIDFKLRKDFLRCFLPEIDCDTEEAFQNFQNALSMYNGKNIIISDEMLLQRFRQEEIKKFAAILSQNWDVKILYTYRHLFDRFPSEHKQRMNPYDNQFGTNWKNWPDKGGTKIVTFEEFVPWKSLILRHIDLFRWNQIFHSVSVFNMYNTEGNDFVLSFLCSMIPEIDVFCKPPEDNEKTRSNDSSSKHLHYDMLAVAAKQKGLLNGKASTFSRPKVRDLIQLYCEKNNLALTKDFTLTCISKDNEKYLSEQSLSFGQSLNKLIVNHGPTSLETHHQKMFEEYRQKNKFCSIDVDKTLQEKRWQIFFTNLSASQEYKFSSNMEPAVLIDNADVKTSQDTDKSI